MISDYQKQFARVANCHLDKIFEKDTDAYNNAQLFLTLLIMELKPLLEQYREDADIINQKIQDARD